LKPRVKYKQMVGEVRRILLLAVVLFVLILSFFSYQHFFVKPPSPYPPGMSDVDKAAMKADGIQANELREVTDALKRNDSGKVIYGDRFMRWTVLAYTLWRVDQGDLTIIKAMEDLMISYYNHAWYPFVKNRPPMPFEGLIQYFRGDGTWENYWCDYKPVYSAAFVLEYYLLSCFDREWGIQNYPILKNVTDSLLKMWLPERHQPSAYVDSDGTTFRIMNITCSVDSAFVYAALISSSQISKVLMNDMQSYENYTKYAKDLITHFYNQTWDWFPTSIFGANPEEEYGTALQVGTTLPFIDADDKIDLCERYLVNNLRVGTSWLLKWKKSDTSPSSRSVTATAGLALKYPQISYDILNAYADAALSNDPWFLTETDEYEGSDPIWVSGKYLQTYVFLKNRMLTGRIPFSPKLMGGNLRFETSFPSDPSGLHLVNGTFPTLLGILEVKAKVTENALKYVIAGAPHQNVTVKFHVSFEPDVSCDASMWGYTDDRNINVTVVWFIQDGMVEIEIEKPSTL